MGACSSSSMTATPDAVNFMAAHGRGLVCLALSAERCGQLGLRAMARRGDMPPGSDFTVSIEARGGVDTGISAGDRAHTIAVAINCEDGRKALVSPGHVFPLCASPGGVLARAGRTEAAVDIARLAGLNPSAAICGIMNPAPPMNFQMGGMGTSFFGDIHVPGDGYRLFYTDHKGVVSRW